MNTQKIFTSIYVNNSWASEESVSGNGSTLKNNKVLLTNLENFIEEYKIKTILDVACGDFNWLQHLDFHNINKYTGIDIVEDLIIKNTKKYSSNKIEFKCEDVINTTFDEYDLVICKDVLFHLSYEDAISTLTNISNSKSKYLISTTFFNHKNFNIQTGGWRPINLETEPFNLSTPKLLWKNIENMDENNNNNNKSIGVWEIK